MKKIIETEDLSDHEKEAVLELWNNEYPAQIVYTRMADFEQYLDNLSGKRYLLLKNRKDEINGWAFRFEREGEVWFAVLVERGLQGLGYGTDLVNELKKKETVLNGWVADHDRYLKQDGSPYTSPMGFYLRNEFVIHNDTRLETEKLSAVKISWGSINH